MRDPDGYGLPNNPRVMNKKDNPSISKILRPRCDAIAERWYREITPTHFMPLKMSQAYQYLVELSEQAITLLLAEPFEPEKAEQIGEVLANLYHLQPEALGISLEVLANQIAEGLPPYSVAMLQPRLAAILGKVAIGFFSKAQQRIIEEHEQILSTLFTEQERTEKDLRVKESAIASSMNAIAMSDMKGTLTYVNRSCLKMWGYEDEKEVLGKSVAEFSQKGDMAEAVVNAVRKGENWIGELVARKKDGSLFHVQLSASVVTDNKGEPLCTMGSFVDITEQKEIEKALRETKSKLEHKTKNLEDANTTLMVLLQRRYEDKKALEENMKHNLRELVLPYLRKVKKCPLNSRQLSYINVIESNLNNISSPFSRILSSRYLEFTATEIRIANLIKEGKATKEMAELMSLSPRTIDSHRESMRKKIGIRGRRQSLRSHLLSICQP